MSRMEFDIQGMKCTGCSSAVQEAIQKISGVKDVEVDLERGKAAVTGNGDESLPAEIRRAIREAGYEVA